MQRIRHHILQITIALAAMMASPTWAANTPHPAHPTPDIVVAPDGSADFKTIQAAIASIPPNNTQRITILIKPGLYPERLRIDPSFITLLGEDRKTTRIEAPPGGTVVTLNGSDFILQNLTLKNTGTDNIPHAVTMASRTADRVVLLDADILSDGGDTLSLWRNDGRYYHARCTFRGGVDYVCPHGWCYITDSTFQSTRNTASLWQDGHYNKDQKFVLKNCTFDGVPGYELGRHHHDALFFLVDCTFSNTMKDRPIYRVLYPLDGGPPTPADIENNKQHDPTNIWGDRNYFFNCHRDGPNGEKNAVDLPAAGVYAWFKDNLTAFSPKLKPHDITAAWTFANTPDKWDPENKLGPTIKSLTTNGNQITITFSENVTAKGKPVLLLADGSKATYAAGSGTTTLLFDTQAEPGTVKTLDLNSGYIFASQASAERRDADLKLP